jgi:hypothetical protein
MMLELVQEEYSVRVVQQCCSQKIDCNSVAVKRLTKLVPDLGTTDTRTRDDQYYALENKY